MYGVILNTPGVSGTTDAATQSVAGLMSADDKKKLDGVATGANAYTHPSYTARTGKPAAAVTVTTGTAFTVSQITSDSAGHVTNATDRSITVNHPSYTAATGKPTANATPGFGGTFTISQVARDTTGHISSLTDRTITIPKTEATTSAAGLMSASDKSVVNNASSVGFYRDSDGYVCQP